MQRLERHLGPPRVRLGRRDPESPEERHRALARLETSLTELGDRFREHRAGPLTWVQLAALRYLLAHGPVTIGTLSRALNVSFSSTTGIVDRLVQLRLVERVHPEDDRRTVIVVATEEGAD
ncbi:MAG: MarR family transcriptional regulator, partial [Clostridia bacterium]